MERAGLQADPKTIIKVVGVGGGGGNAVTHMYTEGIEEVSFVLCNTDRQALRSSAVPVKIILGPTITRGLGAGNDPVVARKAALESEDEVRNMLNDGTEMVFITAGMGGGTGTGAAPVIAQIAKEMEILTVGIVTIPFLLEGEAKIIQALNGVEELSKNVDALLVVNNDRIIDVFPEDSWKTAFKKADNILAIAAKSISEIITVPGEINVDFADVRTTMKNSGVALMSNGYGEGGERVEQAINDALQSPLMNKNDIFNARKILFNIYCSHESELKVKELEYVQNFMSRFRSRDIGVIYGWAYDDSLKGRIKFSIIASGFGLDDIPEVREKHDADRLQNDEEKRRKYKELIEKYYGKQSAQRAIHSVSRASIIVLTPDEMDDDKIISLLEDYPAYNRDPQLIVNARNKAAAENSGSLYDSSSQTAKKPVIKF